LANANTAIDGRSGSGSAGVAEGVSAVCEPARPLSDCHPVDPHRPRNVLDALLAHVLQRQIEPVAHLVADHPADADPTGIGQGLQPGGNVDAVSVDIVVIANDVADIDPHPQLNAAFGGNVGIAFDHAALNLDGVPDRFDDAGKLDQDAVADRLDDAATMLGDLRVEK
jgi:hypothetical protein